MAIAIPAAISLGTAIFGAITAGALGFGAGSAVGAATAAPTVNVAPGATYNSPYGNNTTGGGDAMFGLGGIIGPLMSTILPLLLMKWIF